MKDEKRKQLERAGWRVGSAAEFLGLSEQEAQLVQMKLALADLVRAEREVRKVSQNRLASWTRTSQSRVSKMESAHPSVTIDLMIRTLLALGASMAAIGAAISTPKKPAIHQSRTLSRVDSVTRKKTQRAKEIA